MKVTLYLSAQYETVFLVNGTFVENGKVTASSEEVVFITVLPLSAVLLPYTVKLLGKKVSSNENLCFTFQKSESEIVVYFKPRYNYVYTPSDKFRPPSSVITEFFFAVKSKAITKARSYLSPSLSSSVSDDSLTSFFDGYDDIAEGENGICFLTGKGGRTASFQFTLVGNTLDDVTEI